MTSNFYPFHIIILLLIFSCNASNENPKTNYTSSMLEKMNLPKPQAKQEVKELTIHGDTRLDKYYWMNERDHEDVIAYLESENAYHEEVMKHTEAFQSKLYEEIVGRIKKDDSSVPYKDNGYYYYTRYEKGGEYPIYCRKKGSLDATEEIMLNVNELAKDYSYYQVTGLSVSPDNKLLAFGVDTLSRRIYTIHFKNLETGEILSDKIENTNGSLTWANDNQTGFYAVKNDVTLRSEWIKRHSLNTDYKTDPIIFHEKDETFGTYVFKTKSEKYIVIGSYATLSNEYRILEADKPKGDFRIFQERERKLEYSIDHYEDKFYIVTNLDAKNFRLMSSPLDKTSKSNWTEVIAHRPDALLEDIEIFEKYLVVEERVKGISELRIIPWANPSEEYYMTFDEAAHSVSTSVNLDFDSEVLRFNYTSMTTPNSTFDFNMNTKERTLLKQQAVLSDTFKPENYTSEYLHATASDGTKIPISIVYKKGFDKNGNAPILLYGYGSYGNSMDPYFSSVRLSLLDRGFAFAIAHIRGGQEMGRYWYENGKLLKKKNTFTDFIACGQYLIDNKYTNSDNLYAMGGSAGGLLMGAVININPDMFKGVVAAVPFVDVVTTMLDESIPLTTGEFDEWGNPKDATYYEYIKSYSPYDNIEAKDYPAMLVTTGYHDSQVQYWEPAKWVAKLRELKTDNNPLLFKTDMEAGHSGASGRFQRYKEVAMEYAFLLDLAGINE